MNGETPGPNPEDLQEAGLRPENLDAGKDKHGAQHDAPVEISQQDKKIVDTESKNDFDEERFGKIANFFEKGRTNLGGHQDVEGLYQLMVGNQDLLQQALDGDWNQANVLRMMNLLCHMREKNPEYSNFALSFIENNAGAIERSLEGRWRLYNWEAFHHLALSGDEEQSRLGLAVLNKHKDVLVSEIKSDMKMSSRDLPKSRLITYSNKLLGELFEGGPDAVAIARDILLKVTAVGGYDNLERASDQIPKEIYFLIEWGGQASNTAKEATERILEGFGLDGEEITDAWVKSTDYWSRSKLAEAVETNLKAVLELEARRPGVTKVLNEEFGVADFFRYPGELLISQYIEKDKTDKPYGVILFPRRDENGALYSQKEAIGRLYHRLAGCYFLRIVEAESKFDIARALLTFDRRYGAEHKISFAIIGGHGTENSIRFGGSEKRHFLTIEDLVGRGVGRSHQFFEENPTIILDSCSTGARFGIGQELSKALGAKVIAPVRPTSLKNIHAKIEDGHLDLSVEYEHSGIEKLYLKGAEDLNER